MNIVMYGNGDCGNHGCEAIVRGTIQLLGQNKYAVLSENCEQDKRYGLNAITDVFPAKGAYRKDIRFLKAYAKLKLTGNFTDLDALAYSKEIQRCKKNADVALSVGGDNYCYGNTEFYACLNREFCKKGIKTILWGCSVEPEVVHQTNVKNDLKQYALVVARESITYEAIHRIQENTVLAPDPAFFMLPQRCMLDKRLQAGNIIGINISPMIISNETAPGMAYENYKNLIQYILSETDAVIALIPHVVWASNDDRKVLRQLYDDFGQDPRLVLVEDHTAPELKYIISKCDFFVGARTHATIAAYSSAVPTLVVGYSVKARGIAGDLFGSEEGYVVPVQSLKEAGQLTGAFRILYEQRSGCRGHLQKILPEYCGRTAAAKEAIKELINCEAR